MLKKMMIRIAKVAVLASLIVSTVVMSGCKIDVSAKLGRWFYTTAPDGKEKKECVGTGTECPLDVSVSVSS